MKEKAVPGCNPKRCCSTRRVDETGIDDPRE
jgi:hypothetical protein